jgi:phosphoribosylglycinamide formyltransferase-1
VHARLRFCSRLDLSFELPQLLPIAVLISGGGTTLKNLIEKMTAGELPVEIKLVISSSAKAAGIKYAADAGIPTSVIRREPTDSDDQYCERVFHPCREAGVELVCMAGFLKHVLIPDDFRQKVINIHPSLIPSFCGAGMYGKFVHSAVIEYGVKISGCTVHFVDDQFDHGPVILQKAVEVFHDDTPEQLAARVFEQEQIAYPEAIRLFCEHRLQVIARRVKVLRGD